MPPLRNILATTGIILLGLWLGGLVTLVIFVSSLFAHDRTLASEAAPWLFHVFEPYQLGLGVAAFLILAGWCGMEATTVRLAALAATFVAVLLAVLEISYITPNVNASRAIDPTTFQHFHHLATVNYTVTTVVVLISLLLSMTSILKRM